MRGLAPWFIVVLLLAAGVTHAASERTVDVTIKEDGCPDGHEFCIEPAVIESDPEDTLKIRVTNQGEVRHNLTFAKGTPDALADHAIVEPLEPGATVTMEIPWEDLEAAIDDAETRSFSLACGFQGHAELGEQATLTVTEGQGQNPQPLGWPVTILAVAGAALLFAGRRRSR